MCGTIQSKSLDTTDDVIVSFHHPNTLTESGVRASKAGRQGRQALRVELHRLVQLELRQVDAEDIAPPRNVRPVDRDLTIKPVRGPQVNSRLKMHVYQSEQYQSSLTSMLKTHCLCWKRIACAR